MFRIRPVSGAEPGLVEALVELHRQVFPAHMQYDDPHRYFSEALKSPSHLNIIAEDEKGTIAGYLLGIPQNEVFEELRHWDPQMRNDPERIYLDTIQIMPIFRGRNISRQLIGSLCAEAERRGIRKLSMHARSTTGWNERQHQIFASIRTLRRIENWFDSGEPFDYLEATTELRTTVNGRQRSPVEDCSPT